MNNLGCPSENDCVITVSSLDKSNPSGHLAGKGGWRRGPGTISHLSMGAPLPEVSGGRAAHEEGRKATAEWCTAGERALPPS